MKPFQKIIKSNQFHLSLLFVSIFGASFASAKLVSSPTQAQPSTERNLAETNTPSATENSTSHSPFPSRRSFEHDPNIPGEIHELSVSYLGITGLHVKFEILPHTEMNGRKSYHFRGLTVASSLVNIFFRIQNTVESWMDYEGLFSWKLHLKQDQSNLFRDSLETHAPDKGETLFWNKFRGGNSKDPLKEEKKTGTMPPFSQDSFSAFYFLRTLPLKLGHSTIVPVVSEANAFGVKVTVLKIEELKFDGKRLESFKIKLEKVERDGRISKNENHVWISADSRRLLLRADVKTRFGHVVAKLKKYTPGN